MVISSSPLTWWFSWVALTANRTNIAEPVTQAEIATTVPRLILRPWSLALTTVVMTKAMAPMGWTTVSGADTKAMAFMPMPRAQQQQAKHPPRISQEPQETIGTRARGRLYRP